MAAGSLELNVLYSLLPMASVLYTQAGVAFNSLTACPDGVN